ncbi:unnamed protein product [Calicophoron daubneyi]|uniref:Vacuolar protein sorting-associated protein 35 n=1 Tax=Calicophoron daubneyi TaxID=300641 RepID=A0AAV2TCJ1_CALDB
MQAVDQERLLDEAITSVKQCAFQMERCLDKRNLVDAIQHASDMLREMRTSALSPKSYYELYIAVTEKLRILESYLIEEHNCGRKELYLYETVQYIGSIVPRLYLLITIGVYHIKCSELSRREIMRDLVEMCSGVQHPIRGLFLRSYLLHALRADLLPDVEDSLPHLTQEDGTADTPVSDGSHESPRDTKPDVPPNITAPSNPQGTITDSINFLLLNFAEMNKLWVRMQHQGHSRDLERREQERRELRLLVGTNLNRLSQLENITVLRYKTRVLPPILEQIINCRDVIAQDYLMDVIIQVFPDEFHLATLPLLLQTCAHLQPGVKPRQIICSLIERLSQYALAETASGRPLSIPIMYKIPVAAPPNEQSSSPGAPHACRSNGEEGPEQPNGSVDQEGEEKKISPDESVLSSFQNAVLFSIFFNEVNQLLDARISLSEEMVANEGHGNKNPESRQALINAIAANGLPLEDFPAIYIALVYLAMVLYPKNSEALVDACLNATADRLIHVGVTQVSPVSPLSRELLRLLHLPLGGTSQIGGSVNHIGVAGAIPSAPLGALGELRTVIGMDGFRRLVSLLDPKTTKCRLACNLFAGALEREERQRQLRRAIQEQKGSESAGDLPSYSSRLLNEADVDGLFDLIDGLLTPDSSAAEDPDEFAEAQSLVAGVMHLLGPEPRSEDPEMCQKLLVKAQQRLAQAGTAVIRFNFPVLVFEGLQLVETYAELGSNGMENWDANVQKVVEFIHRCITLLVAADAPELALRLFLKAALMIDKVPFNKRESMTYEFVSQALTLYEEGVSEARAQIDAISLITSTLCQMRCFGQENRNTLRTQCARAAAHLLRKHDQSRAVAAAAHLFWPVPVLARQNTEPSQMVSVKDRNEKPFTLSVSSEEISQEELDKLRDAKAVIACLDRAVRLAKDCMDSAVQAQLFIEVLNHAITFRLAGCSEVTDGKLNELISSIRNLLKELNQSPTLEQTVTHFSNTLQFMRNRKKEEENLSGESDQSCALFASVDLS